MRQETFNPTYLSDPTHKQPHPTNRSTRQLAYDYFIFSYSLHPCELVDAALMQNPSPKARLIDSAMHQLSDFPLLETVWSASSVSLLHAVCHYA